MKLFSGNHAPRTQPGIRSRIMLYLVAFVAFVIALLWLFQVVLLDSFYRYNKQRQITLVADALVQNINNDDLAVLAEHLCDRYDVCILLVDNSGKALLSVDTLRSCLIHQMSSRDTLWWIHQASENPEPVMEFFASKYYMSTRYNYKNFIGMVPSRDDAERMTLMYARTVQAAGGRSLTLMLNTPITPVSSTVDTLRFQLVVITGIVLVGALLLAFLISRHVTRPIIETSVAARSLSQSRFDKPASHRYREIDELNDTLEKAAEELSQVEHLQHELIANISHDLRTPLTMIGGYAEMVRDMPDEGTPENMQIIIDETSRLSTLVNELLDFSRLQTGSEEMHPAPFALTGCVEAIITRIGKLVEKDGYTIRFTPASRLNAVADETRIEQVVYNLIGNALTYTGSDRLVTVEQLQMGDTVRISIHDTGKGIPEDELDKIWNRYYRTKETHRRAVVGSGLGLNIVQTILEKHNARYGVKSREGEGTTFWFELPLAAPGAEDDR